MLKKKFDLKHCATNRLPQVEPSPAIRVLLQEEKIAPATRLREMATHPQFRRELRLLQAETWLLYTTAVENVADTLPGIRPDAAIQQPAVLGASLSRVSRRAHTDVKDRLKDAKLVTTAALLNRNNPDWNVVDASTDKPDFDDPIVLLMELDLNA